MLSKQEQRELLLLQCDLARAKLRYTQQQAMLRKQRTAQSKSGSMAWQLADAAGEVARNTDSLKLAMLPAKWKHRAAVLLGLLALEWAERWATGRRRR